jgi:glycine/D-amino acid oxidase-like deaminating enzyme
MAIPRTADIVIAGSGIVGLALAWRLARSGFKIVAFDAGAAGGKISAATFAWINGTSKTENEAYHRLNRAGVDAYEKLARQIGASAIGLAGNGSLHWAGKDHPDLLDRMRDQGDVLRRWGYSADWVDAPAMRRLAPGLAVPDGAEGLFASIDRWIEVPRLLGWLKAQLAERGAILRENCAITGLERGPNGAVRAAITPEGVIPCKHLVIAGGTATPAIVEMATGRSGFPVDEVTGLLVETPAAPLASGFDMVLWSPDETGFHMRRTPGGGLLLGADDVDAQIRADPSDESLAAGHKTLIDRALDWMPELRKIDLHRGATHRIGRRAVPTDGHSILGPLKDTPGVYVAVTHSGVTLALAIAELLAEEITTSKIPAALGPFRPDRFGF